MSIDLSKYKVVYGEKVVRAVALMHMEFPDGEDCEATVRKPKFIEVLVINSDGNLELLNDEAWRFQFVPILEEKE